MRHPDEEQFMVGKVIFQNGSQILEASLDEETHWHCRHVDFERFLNASCRLRVSCNTEDGIAWQTLSHAEAILGGQAVYL
jgi:hypothetical protein